MAAGSRLRHRSNSMLRTSVNAVVLTFVVSEWLSEKPGRRLVPFARRTWRRLLSLDDAHGFSDANRQA